jgi:hypothetical protein
MEGRGKEKILMEVKNHLASLRHRPSQIIPVQSWERTTTDGSTLVQFFTEGEIVAEFSADVVEGIQVLPEGGTDDRDAEPPGPSGSGPRYITILPPPPPGRRY